MGLEDMPYDIPNVRAAQCRAYAHTRVGWHRSVSNIPRALAIKSITPELAHEMGRDANDFLQEQIRAPRQPDWTEEVQAQPVGNTQKDNEQLNHTQRQPPT